MGQTVFRHDVLALSSFVLSGVKNRSHSKTEKSHNFHKTREPKKPSCCFVVLSCYHGNPGFTKERIICQYDSSYCLWQYFNNTQLTCDLSLQQQRQLQERFGG